MMFPKKGEARLRALITLALLIAIEVVLSRFLSFSQLKTKFSFAFVAVVLAGRYFGPVGGALCGGLSDLIGALLFPIGAYHPGFTLTATLTGLVYGLCFQKGYRLSRACLAVAYSQVVGTLLLNTLWVYTIAKSSYLVLLTARLPEFFLMGMVKLLTITLLLPRLDRWLLPLTQGRGKELRP